MTRMQQAALVVSGAVFAVLLWWAADAMHRAEAASATFRWQHITAPALEGCRRRGGIANVDGWGKVACDR